jgi:hypothetical protein
MRNFKGEEDENKPLIGGRGVFIFWVIAVLAKVY